VAHSPHSPFRSAEAKAEYLAFYDNRAKHWPIPSEVHTIDTSYGPTFVRISGPANADPLVLLHGGNATSLGWIPVIAGLSEQYRTYAPDIIGASGRSIGTRPIHNAPSLVIWLDELLDGLHLRNPIHLLGKSYGGWIAAQYALHAPHRLRKTILLAPAGAWSMPLGMIPRFVLSMTGNPRFVRDLFTWLFNDLARNGPSAIDPWVEQRLLEMKCFERHAPVRPHRLTYAQWNQLPQPLLLLVGERDNIYPARRVVEHINRVAPHIKTVILPDLGHALEMAQPDVVNAKILEFLKEP